MQAISGEVGWQKVTVPIAGSGPVGISWSYVKNFSGGAVADAGWIDELVYVPTLSNAMETPPLTWTNSGAAGWAGEAVVSHGGTPPVSSPIVKLDSAQIGAITHSQQSTLETNVTGPATLTYWWKVSSEANYDYLRFFLDGTEAAPAISGEVGWQQMSVAIPAGSHNLRWTYSKDVSDSAGADAGWVDEVILTPPHPVTSPLSVNATQGTPFNHQVTAANGANTFAATLSGFADPTLPPDLVIDRTTGVIPGTPVTSGTYNITMSASGHYSWWGKSTATLAFTIAPSSTSNAPALDAGNLTWRTGGTGSWFGQTGISRDGVDAVRGGGIANSSHTDLETTVTGPGVLSFWWKVSSEPDHDYVRFEMDDAQQPGATEISGAVDWQLRTIPDIGAYEAGGSSNYNAWIYESLPITTFTRSGGNLNITVLTVAGRNYQVIQSDTLLGDSWEATPGLAGITGNGNSWTFQIPESPQTRRFHRVQVTLP